MWASMPPSGTRRELRSRMRRRLRGGRPRNSAPAATLTQGVPVMTRGYSSSLPSGAAEDRRPLARPPHRLLEVRVGPRDERAAVGRRANFSDRPRGPNRARHSWRGGTGKRTRQGVEGRSGSFFNELRARISRNGGFRRRALRVRACSVHQPVPAASCQGALRETAPPGGAKAAEAAPAYIERDGVGEGRLQGRPATGRRDPWNGCSLQQFLALQCRKASGVGSRCRRSVLHRCSSDGLRFLVLVPASQELRAMDGKAAGSLRFLGTVESAFARPIEIGRGDAR